jgi:hypothetical protein
MVSAMGLTCDDNTCTGKYEYGTQLIISATANSGSTLTGWSECDSIVENTCAVTVNQDREITAAFDLLNYTITASVGGDPLGGSVTPSNRTVNHGASATFTVTTNVGYTASVSEGTLVGSTWTITNVTSSHTATVTFTINNYTITVTSSSGGTITPGSTTVNHGSSQSLTISPNTGYHIQNVIVDGTPQGDITSYTFTNVTANHTIEATFALNTYTVTASVGGDPLGGSVTPSSRDVTHGASATFTVTTNVGYTASVSEGTLVGSTWTITNVTSSHTATVTFAINTYIISGFVRTSGSTGISDVVMDGLPGNPVTRADGFYSATIPYNWSGTVVPTRSGYKFDPHSIQYANVNEDRIAGDCIGQPLQSFPFKDDFSTDKGWFGYEPGGWERKPAVAGVGENGNPDPGTDYSVSTDNYILGFAIGADYPNDHSEKSIISPPIDCIGQGEVFLKLRRWLNVEGNESDHARIYISVNGTDWTEVWENPPIDLMDNEWVPAVFDISSVAANQATVYIKFTMGPTNSSRRFSGWNIDDFEVTSEAVFPSEGTMGTELSITGSNFGTKKGKVLIGSTPLTIIDWADGLIHCRLTKVLAPGVYDLTIQPSGPKGTPPIIEKEAFVVKAPEIYSIEQGEGTANDQVTINGKFFGTKKGAVYLEYEEGGSPTRKSCKVSSWVMDPKTGDSEIVFIVPAMSHEVCNVVVDPSGALPETEEEHGFEVKAPEIDSVEPGSGSVGEQITILGNFFGSKKSRVYLGYLSKGKPTKKSCSILSWSDDEIVFTVPTLPIGSYDVIVTNVVGSAQYGQKFNIEPESCVNDVSKSQWNAKRP